MSIVKRVFCILLSVALIVTLTPAMGQYEVQAASKVVKVDSTLMTLDDFYDWLDDYGDAGTHKVYMMDDWRTEDTIEFPQGCNIELYMQGHMIRRTDADSFWHDSVIEFGSNESDASYLTIYGGDKSLSHYYAGFCSDKDRVTRSREAKGGLITGGSGDNDGGAFYLNGDNLYLTVNDVTIGGNSADSDGGAIWIDDMNCRVTLRNSDVCYNWAGGDAGAIFINDNNNKLVLDNTKLSWNWAQDDGGAIYTSTSYAENLLIKGKNGAVIEHNMCNDEYGGAIYLGNDCISIAGLSFIGNKALNGQGGAIYSLEETINIGNCIFEDNESKLEGGAIYVANDETILSGCEITGNKSGNSKGNGVFVEPDVDEGFKVTGKTIIRDNGGNKYYSNLFMSDSDPEDSTIDLSGLTRGSDVHIGYVQDELDDKLQVSAKQNAYDASFLTSDNSGYYFKWDKKDRHLYLVKGKQPEKKKATKVNAGQATAEGEYNGYDLMHGYMTHADSAGGDDTDIEFYYTDGYFDEGNDPSEYNEHLATTSLNMASSSAYSAVGESKDYLGKHSNVRQFLADIGCDDQNIYVNDAYTKKPTTSSIGVAIASKSLMKKKEDTGRILVPVVIRSAGYEAEWASNATLGNDGEAAGFKAAAETASEEVYNYLVSHNLLEKAEKGKLVFWVTGFSRGGATANLLSKRIIERYAGKGTYQNNTVYAYTFATPLGGVESEAVIGIDYSCIHNTMNYADVVPLVAPEKMGFKRYGTDHYLPGTEVTGELASVDNAPVKTTDKAYSALKDDMVKQLSYVDSAKMFDDYFHSAYFAILGGDSYYGIELGDTTEGAEEDWERDLVDKLVEQAIKNRSNYSSTKLKIGQTEYTTIEKAVSDLLGVYFSMDEESRESFIENASTITSYIGLTDYYNLWKNLLGNWKNLSDSKKQAWSDQLLLWIEETGALDSLSSYERADFINGFPVLLNFAMCFVDWDYGADSTKRLGIEEHLVYAGTLMHNAGKIMANHYFEYYLAWARSYDDFYSSASCEYEIVKPETVDEPSALVQKDTDKKSRMLPGLTNKMKGDQKLILDSEDTKGEAIYYTLKNDKTGEVTDEAIYNGPMLLPYEEGSSTTYTLTARAFQYGKYSESAEYTIKVEEPRHKVTVKNGDDVNTRMYEAGADASAVAIVPDGKVFDHWKVSVDNIENSKVVSVNDSEEKAQLIFGSDYESDLTKGTVSFTMPEFKDDAYSAYELVFEAVYADKIDSFEIEGDIPEAGRKLPNEFTVKAGTRTVTIKDPQWSYEYSGKTIVASGDAYKETSYTAKFRIAQDEENGIAFKDGITAADITAMEGTEVTAVSKDASDGSLSVTLVFDETGSEAGYDKPDAVKKLTIKAYDANLDKELEDMEISYSVVEGKQVTVTAPISDDETFVRWKDDSDFNIGNSDKQTVTFTPDEDKSEYVITAVYYPVVKKVSATLSGVPEAGKAMPGLDSFEVTIGNTYGIDPEDVKVTWTPAEEEDGTAEYSTAYTATVSLAPRDENGIHIITINGEEAPKDTYVKGRFFFADQVDAAIDGTAVSLDKNEKSVSYTYEATEVYKRTIASLGTIAQTVEGIPCGSDECEIIDKLPKTVKGYLTEEGAAIEGAASVDLEIEWDKPVNINGGKYAYDPIEYSVTGRAKIPEGYRLAEDVANEFTIKAFVEGAPLTKSPVASIESGVYHDDFTVTVESEEGAGLFYTLDGSEPKTNNPVRGPIEIKRGEDPTEPVVLKVMAWKQGKRPSTVTTYVYSFDYQLYIPTGKSFTYDEQEHIGVRAGEFYTLSVDKDSGAYIDKDGNAVATEPGRYEVTAKVNHGYQWIIGTGDDGTPLTNSKDQIITFEISKPDTANTIRKIDRVDEEIYTLPWNIKNDAEIYAELPKTVKGYIVDDEAEEGFKVLDLAIVWTSANMTGGISEDPAEMVEYTVTGAVQIPEDYWTAKNVDTKVAVKAVKEEAPFVMTPVAGVSSGVYDDDIAVTLKSEEGAVIHYTLDGSNPTKDSPVYNGPIKIKAGDKVVLKAVAEKAGLRLSNIAAYEYTFYIPDYSGAVKMLKAVLTKDEAAVAAVEAKLSKKDEIGAKAKLTAIKEEIDDIESSNLKMLKANPDMAKRLDELQARIDKDIANAIKLEKIRKQYTPSSKQISKVTAGSKKLTVSWAKASTADQKKFTGYQVRYSLKSDFSSGVKTVKVKKSAKSLTISSLKSKKKYYVQLRKYRTYNGKTYCSDWSKKKYTTTK